MTTAQLSGERASGDTAAGGREARLRWLSVLVLAAIVACYVASATFDALNPRAASSWGSGALGVNAVFIVGTLCFPVVGMLIVHRDPRNRIGWLMLAIGVVWGWSGLADGYVVYGLRTDPGSLPRPDVIAALSGWAWVPAIGLMGVYLILLFPDGRLPSPRWRWVAWLAAVAMVLGTLGAMFRPGPIQDTSVQGVSNPWGIGSPNGFFDMISGALILLPIAIVLSAASLVVRFRRSRGVERLQLKWLATAGALVAILYAVAMTATFATISQHPVPRWALATQDAALDSFIVIPVAVGVAILKHRLYGIDVVINKSLVFGALATFITAVYVTIVVGLGSLIGRGDRPNLVLSIAATALVAVAFQPVRDKVQRFANRLVYGARATPYEVLADFADRMGGAYAAADLLPMMARTVGEGVAASRVDIWLAVGPGLTREASWPEPDQRAPLTVAGVDDLVADCAVPVRHRGDLLGAISVAKPAAETLTPTERRLLEDVAAQAGLVLRNVRLIEDLRSSRVRLVTTQDEERRRLERNLHDGAQQSLVAVALMLRMARSRLGTRGETVGTALDQATDQLSLAIEELRDLARGIHPVILSERGLGPALDSLAERSAVPVVVDYRLRGRLPSELEGTLYFVAAEALANVAKHAAAHQAVVLVDSSGPELTLEVRDDGIGGARLGAGSGLLGLVDRASVVDGTLTVESPPGGGTCLRCAVPYAASTVDPEALTENPLGIPQGADQ